MRPDHGILARSALEVAPLLLGALLGRDEVLLRITEVEAYLGPGLDPVSQAFRGQTRRNASMFGLSGQVYAYFTYGMHVCANIVCSPVGDASAVLLRAGEIIEGVTEARMSRVGRQVRVTGSRQARPPAGSTTGGLDRRGPTSGRSAPGRRTRMPRSGWPLCR